MSFCAEDMLKFLPEFTKIAKTPDIMYGGGGIQRTSVQYEDVELKTEDIVRAFLGLQIKAVNEASRVKDERIKAMAISRIESMVFFDSHKQ